MMKKQTELLIFQRLFFFIIFYVALSLLLGSFLNERHFVALFNYTFVVLFSIDIAFNIIFIFYEKGLLNSIIVFHNILFKLVYIILCLTVMNSRVYSGDILEEGYYLISWLGILIYSIFIILFMIDSYRNIKGSINKSFLIILLNGLVVFSLGFLINKSYDGIENYDYISNFDIPYSFGLFYIPMILILILFVISLFKNTVETKEE